VLDLAPFASMLSRDSGLCVLSTLRGGGGIQSSMVNAGVIDDPVEHVAVVALVASGDSHKVVNLRERPFATVLARDGWAWTAAEGSVALAGPDDPMPGVDADRLRALLRDVFAAAIGGSPDDWQAHADNMMLEGHVVVLLRPTRLYSGAP
jgi:hypothetical protein